MKCSTKERVKEDNHDRIYYFRKHSCKQLYLGSTGHDLHHRSRTFLKPSHPFYPDPPLSLCHPHHSGPHVQQKRCLRRRHYPLPGSLYCPCGYCGYGKYRRCSRSYCHRRSGRCILDVDFRIFRNVHQIFRGYSGGSFPGN